MNSTKIQWIVQFRVCRAHKWKNNGVFETRGDARTKTHSIKRDAYARLYWVETRVVRYVKSQK